MLKQSILAIDIGGTKIAYGLFRYSFGKNVEDTPFFKNQLPTPKGKHALAACVRSIVHTSIIETESKGYSLLPCVGIGSPGRFLNDEDAVIASGSAENLASFPGEFDGVSLVTLFKGVLPEKWGIIIKNDALAQMAGGLYVLLKKKMHRPFLLNQKIGYIGPGTGLGGGFGETDSKGNLHFRTDGHICDMLLSNGQSAEGALSGKTFERVTGIMPVRLNEDAGLFHQWEDVIKQYGRIFAEIIQRIYSGNIQKINPRNNWPDYDRVWVKGIDRFLLGGSLATKGRVGRTLQEEACRCLHEWGLYQIRLFPIPDSEKAGLLGMTRILKRGFCA